MTTQTRTPVIPRTKAQARYVTIKSDRAYRLALRKIAADHGLTLSAYVERLVREDYPGLDELIERFERS